MAIITKPETNDALDLFKLDRTNLPPAGTFAAVVLDIVDKLGVERTKFQSNETETVDLTAFLFGYRGPDGAQYRIDTRPMKISGHPKSALFKFLTALMGRAPEYGWDYMALKGMPCLITVAHMVSQHGNPYAAITAAVPMPQGFATAAPVAPAAPTPTMQATQAFFAQAPQGFAAPLPQGFQPAAPQKAKPPVIPIADDDNNGEEIPF